MIPVRNTVNLWELVTRAQENFWEVYKILFMSVGYKGVFTLRKFL